MILLFILMEWKNLIMLMIKEALLLLNGKKIKMY
jgi:hypothetical protein